MIEKIGEITEIARSIDPDFDTHPVVEDQGPPISAAEIDRMCAGYFRYHEYIARGYIDQAPEQLAQISDAVMEMTDRNPERLWPLLVELVERAPTEEVRNFVAAGPLEDLVQWHGERFLDRFEQRVRESRSFHEAMRAVWGWERTPDAVRERMFALLTPDWDEVASGRHQAR